MFNKKMESCLIKDGKPEYLHYHNITALDQDNSGTFSLYINKALKDKEFINKSCNYWKSDLIDKVILPNISEENFKKKTLIEVLTQRRSRRKFIESCININELSILLKYSLGITGYYSKCSEKEHANLYCYPTAGGLNCLRFIIIINNVKDINNGIYLYNQEEHSLLLLKNNFKEEEYRNITASWSLVKNNAFSIHFFADDKFNIWKYQDRGYRFMNIECGHAAQNLYLMSEYLDFGTVGSGGFLDKEFPKYLKNNTNNFDTDWLLLYEMYFGNIDSMEENRFL